MLDFGSSGPGFGPGGTLRCVLGQDTTHMEQVYKWVPANLMLGVTKRWTSIPSRGEEKYLSSLHATETGLMSYLARTQTSNLFIQGLQPSLNVNIGHEKLLLY